MNAPIRPAPALPLIVTEFSKNKRESFRVTLDRFKGTVVVDVRVFFKDGDAMRPTRSGISTSIKHLRALAHALNKTVEQAEEQGLIDG